MSIRTCSCRRSAHLGLWGIDELVTYHYLEAELFRSSRIRPDEYSRSPNARRRTLIWQRPVRRKHAGIRSYARRIAVLNAFGLPTDLPT